MLVLARKRSQTISIGDDIRITVVEIHSNYVKIGIDAPRNVAILRDDADVRVAPMQQRSKQRECNKPRR